MAVQNQYQVAIINSSDAGVINFQAEETSSSELNCQATPPLSIDFAENFAECQVSFMVTHVNSSVLKALTNFDGSDFSILGRAGTRVPLQAAQFATVVYIQAICSVPQPDITSAQFVMAPLWQGVHG